MAVDISSLEVVSFLLVTSMSWEQAEMGTTSNVRNLQPDSIATETIEFTQFGLVIKRINNQYMQAIIGDYISIR